MLVQLSFCLTMLMAVMIYIICLNVGDPKGSFVFRREQSHCRSGLPDLLSLYIIDVDIGIQVPTPDEVHRGRFRADPADHRRQFTPAGASVQKQVIKNRIRFMGFQPFTRHESDHCPAGNRVQFFGTCLQHNIRIKGQTVFEHDFAFLRLRRHYDSRKCGSGFLLNPDHDLSEATVAVSTDMPGGLAAALQGIPELRLILFNADPGDKRQTFTGLQRIPGVQDTCKTKCVCGCNAVFQPGLPVQVCVHFLHAVRSGRRLFGVSFTLHPFEFGQHAHIFRQQCIPHGQSCRILLCTEQASGHVLGKQAVLNQEIRTIPQTAFNPARRNNRQSETVRPNISINSVALAFAVSGTQIGAKGDYKPAHDVPSFPVVSEYQRSKISEKS